MMMKKGMVLLVMVMMVTGLCGCGKVSYRDGSYRAEAEEYDLNGWKEYLAVRVENGKIVRADYDAVNETDGRKKTEDAEYQEKYRAAGLGTDPADTAARLTDSYLERQESGKVDAVSGATNSSKHFVQLAQALEKRMKDGETGEIKVDLGE